jgi:hypothetical protein
VFTWRHGAVFRFLPDPLSVGTSASGPVMTGVSVTDLATVSQQSRKSLSKPIAGRVYLGLRPLDPVIDFSGRCRLFGVCRGFTQVVCETVERLFSQDRGYRMANTESPMTRKPVHPSKQSNDKPDSTRLLRTHQYQPATD